MHLSVRTLHGIRALSKLADDPGVPFTTKELASQKYIDRDYLTQVLNTLKHADIIESKKGPSGGYFLERNPESITLGEIIRCLEGPTIISPCTEPEHSDCEIIDGCATQDTLAVVASEIDELLDNITLQDIHSGTSELSGSEIPINS